MSTNYVITIGRQFGSLGRDIGKMLAKELDIHYYDRDLLEKSAETMGIPLGNLTNYDETLGGSFTKMLYPLGLGSATTHNKLFEHQKSMILDLAKNQSCVIVGRCADYILRDNKNVLSVFIYAPYKHRLWNSIHRLGLYNDEAEKMIERVDKAREAYHKYYTTTSSKGLENRNLLIDSSMLPLEGTVAVLKDIAVRKFGLENEE